jgi:hypothetical protein
MNIIGNINFENDIKHLTLIWGCCVISKKEAFHTDCIPIINFLQVQQNQIEINLEHEMIELREHGMSRVEEKYQTAKKQASIIVNAFEYCYISFYD